MKRQITSLLIVIPLLILLFPGCSFGQKYLEMTPEGQYEDALEADFASPRMAKESGGMQMAVRGAAPPPPEPMESGMDIAPGGAEEITAIERRVIYTANISVEVKKAEDSIEKIKKIAKEAKGIIADTSVTEVGEGRTNATVVLKVPADKFEAVLKQLGGLGQVKSQDSHGADITEEYYDLQARLKNAKRMEDRLVDLLENKSKSLKDMLDVEKELGRVRENIERLEGKKRYYDSRVAMSTITVNLFEPYKYTKSILDPVKKAFDKAGELFMKSVGAVLLFLAVAIPWFIVIGLIIYFIIFLIKRAFRKRREKKVFEEEGKIEDPDDEFED